MTEQTLSDRASQLGEWFAEYAELHRDKLGPVAMQHGAHSPEFFDAQAKVERNLDRARYAYSLQDDIADRFATLQATVERQAAEIARLTSERRNIISHAIGGYTEAVDSMNLNDACVAISAFRNRLYADGQALGCTAERARMIAAMREPDAELHYVMKEALAKAYRDGATDVHNAWENDEHSREPDFGEAASDYGSHHATAALSAAADHMEAGDAN